MGCRVLTRCGYHISVSSSWKQCIKTHISIVRANHPDTIVYCQDTNLLLKHAIEMHEGQDPEPLLSNDGKTYCKPMPKKGEVDFVYGGKWVMRT